jgi:hypothetical protein
MARDLGSPASGAYRDVTIRHTWRGLTSGQPVMPSTVSLVVSGKDGRMGKPIAVDPATLRYAYEDATERVQGGSLDAAAVLTWMKSCGVTGDEVLLAAEAKEILRNVHATALRPTGPPPQQNLMPFSSGRSSSGQTMRGPLRPWLALMAAVFVIWAAGVRVVARWVDSRSRRA